MTTTTDEDLAALRASAKAQVLAHQDADGLWLSFVKTGLATVLVDGSSTTPEVLALSSIAHEVGYALSDAPFVATAAGVGHLVATLPGGTEVDALRAELESGVVAVLTVPFTECFATPTGQSLLASAPGSGTVTLSGRVPSVMAAEPAGVFVVPVDRGGNPQLAVVRGGPRVRVELEDAVDPTRQPASVIFDEAPFVVLAEGEVVLGQLRRALAAETLVVAAEMVGAAQAALDVLTQFVAQRKAFGQLVGTFQAVRHRCADRLVDIAAAGALVTEAGQLLQQPVPSSPQTDAAVALAKIAAQEALLAVAEDVVLLRGAFGFTQEGGGHLYLRRWMADSSYRGRSAELGLVVNELLAAGPPGPHLADEFSRNAHEWLTANAPAFGDPVDAYGYFPKLTDKQVADRLRRARAWERCKFDAGWAGVSMPTEYGGQGGSRADAARFAQLEQYQVLPLNQFEITSAVTLPSILEWGTEEQRRRYIPKILSGDEVWCQMTSEPDAGSDLAMLNTRATRTDYGWELTGRKIWTSGAAEADFGMILARTDPDAPKHKGISAFIVPMSSPGLEVTPITQASGARHFCEVLLDHVVLPHDSLLGQPGDGWKIAVASIAFERLSLSGSGVPFGRIFDLGREVKAYSDPELASDLRSLLLTMRGLEALTRQALTRVEAGSMPGAETSINKLLTGRAASQSARLVERMLGPELASRSEWSQFVLGSVGLRIGGGTEEIQRDILADRVLHMPPLPRDDRTTPWSQIARS